jgi:hypothetical protein
MGLVFWQIAQKPTSEGFKVSKDKRDCLHQEYKGSDGIDYREDEELKQLKDAEKKARRNA